MLNESQQNTFTFYFKKEALIRRISVIDGKLITIYFNPKQAISDVNQRGLMGQLYHSFEEHLEKKGHEPIPTHDGESQHNYAHIIDRETVIEDSSYHTHLLLDNVTPEIINQFVEFSMSLRSSADTNACLKTISPSRKFLTDIGIFKKDFCNSMLISKKDGENLKRNYQKYYGKRAPLEGDKPFCASIYRGKQALFSNCVKEVSDIPVYDKFFNISNIIQEDLNRKSIATNLDSPKTYAELFAVSLFFMMTFIMLLKLIPKLIDKCKIRKKQDTVTKKFN